MTVEISTPSRTTHPADATPTLVIDRAAVATRRAPVFGPVTARLDTPVTVVIGNRGSGRTSLLLSMGGRMRLTGGRIRTLGLDVTTRGRDLRRITALAGFDPIDRPDGAARVSEVLHERQTWTAPWYRRVPRPAEKQVHAALMPVFGDTPAPPAGELVRDLSESQDLLLRIALALVERPRLLLIDDLDAVKNPEQRAHVASRLEAIARGGTVVVVGSADPRDVALFAPELTSTLLLTR